MFVIDKKLTSWSSIERARRKVNELYPATRGASYKHRQAKQLPFTDEVMSVKKDKE
jgi:hypothetical protein